MSDFTTPTGHTGGDDWSGARDPRVPGTLEGAGPVHPEEGSPLALLLRRQSNLPSTGRLLGFVPAQVR